MTNTRGRPAQHPRVAIVGLLVGVLVFLVLIFVRPPWGVSQEAWSVAAIAALMAIWWITEAVPLAATALMPVVLLPMMGIAPIEKAAAAYANPLIFLFLGGFLIARSMERWQLQSYIAQFLANLGGGGPGSVIAAIMVATAFLSLWISNTAAALVMLPIGQSIIARRREGLLGGEAPDDQFAPALMLGIAFSATIGGMTTLIGTPPNAIFAAFLKSSYGIEVGFAQWMLVGLPIAMLLLPLTWLILTRIAFQIPAGDQSRDDADAFGASGPAPLSSPAKTVSVIIGLAALALIFRPALQNLVPALPISDAGIFLLAALALFAVPASGSGGDRLLGWQDFQSIRWDVLILVGGGLALASAIEDSGLSRWIGTGLSALDLLPVFAIALVAMASIVLLGELASNTAMAAVFLPIAGAAAVSMGLDPLTLALPVALAASLGFMLPVATPPNAIVYGSGEVANTQMMKAGAMLDAGAILVVYAVAMLLGPYVIHS